MLNIPLLMKLNLSKMLSVLVTHKEFYTKTYVTKCDHNIFLLVNTTTNKRWTTQENPLIFFKDVGAAVFMASATAMPELFTNLISTFIAESDMGLGAVIGALMWNILGVASLSSLATKMVCTHHWWNCFKDYITFYFSQSRWIGYQ